MRQPILFVAGRDPEEEVSGGHAKYVLAHAYAAQRAGFAPHLFCVASRRGRFARAYGTAHCLDARWLPARQMFVARHGPRIAAAVVREARACPMPFVIHGFGVWGAAAVTAARRLAALGLDGRTLVSSYTTYEEENRSKLSGVTRDHGTWTRLRCAAEVAWIRASVNRYERLAYEGADTVLYQYDSVRTLLERRYALDGRVAKVPCTSPTAFRASAGEDDEEVLVPPGDAPLVLAISRHDPRKGVDVLIRALARLRDDGHGFRACLLGGGPVLSKHRALVRRLRLAERVTLPGAVPEVTPYLRAAGIFALPSLHEQSGSLAVLEAMQAGLPIVASACDGVPEDLVDGVDGLLVSPGSVEALAAALERLLEDPDLGRRIGAEARRTFERRFSADRMAAALGDLYAGADRSGDLLR